jgi:hypothetical protein
MSKFITGFAFGLGLWGLVALIRGVALLPPIPTARGARARLIGVLAMLPLPAASGLGYLWALVAAPNGWIFTWEQLRLQGIIVEAVLVLSALLTMYLLAGRSISMPPARTAAGKADETGPDASGKSRTELDAE